jgi:hypothetical protein
MVYPCWPILPGSASLQDRQLLNRLIVRVLSDDRQLLARPVYLRAGNVVCAVRKLGELRSDGHGILRVVEVARNPKTLNCFLLLVEHEGDRVIWLDVVRNDEGHHGVSSAQLQRDIPTL